MYIISENSRLSFPSNSVKYFRLYSIWCKKNTESSSNKENLFLNRVLMSSAHFYLYLLVIQSKSSGFQDQGKWNHSNVVTS